MTTINRDGTREASGDFVQVSRLGHPLVNEVVIPTGLKDAFNSLTPDQRRRRAARRRPRQRPRGAQAHREHLRHPGARGPARRPVRDLPHRHRGPEQARRARCARPRCCASTPRSSRASAPNRLGVLAKDTAGFPNGRRLTDDVVDIELQALEGAVRTGELVEALAAGDGVNANDKEFGRSFPYVALPHSGTSAWRAARAAATRAVASLPVPVAPRRRTSQARPPPARQHAGARGPGRRRRPGPAPRRCRSRHAAAPPRRDGVAARKTPTAQDGVLVARLGHAPSTAVPRPVRRLPPPPRWEPAGGRPAARVRRRLGLSMCAVGALLVVSSAALIHPSPPVASASTSPPLAAEPAPAALPAPRSPGDDGGPP